MDSPFRRMQTDIRKLMTSGYSVKVVSDRLNKIYVLFNGPEDSIYKGGVWKVYVEFPENYPYSAPSIMFENKIFHPNIDEDGAVCVDVLNENWRPHFDLFMVFEFFIPMLLREPNPHDPYNEDAGFLMMQNLQKYEETVKRHTECYAKKEDITM